MSISFLPILADMQLEAAAVLLFFRRCHVAPWNGLFCTAIWPVLARKTAHFARQNDTFRNSLDTKRLANTVRAVAINIIMLMAAYVCWQAQSVWVKLFAPDFWGVFSRLFLCRKEEHGGSCDERRQKKGRKEPQKWAMNTFCRKSLSEFFDSGSFVGGRLGILLLWWQNISVLRFLC